MRLDMNGHDIPHGEHLAVVDVEGRPMVVGAGFMCAICGQRPQYEMVDGAVHADRPCAYPDGITTLVGVAFPSGKIIVTDDLRPVYDVDTEGFASYNTALGQHQYAEAMAKIGCAYGAVRNTSPSLYRLRAPGQFIIASPAYSEDEDDWGDCELDFTGSQYRDAEKIASICTDLWAYSIADFGDWKARGGDPATLGWTDTVVDVTPGTYQFTHHTGERGFDWNADEIIFAHMELIR